VPRTTAPERITLSGLAGHLARGALAPALAALARGASASADGAWGSSSALAAAAAVCRAPASVLVVIAHPGDLEAWEADLATFTGVEPDLLPAVSRVSGGKPSDVEVGERLRLVRRMMDHPPKLLLAPIAALLQPVPTREEVLGSQRVLRRGDLLDPEELAMWLIAQGYQSAEAVESPGEVSRRGGILDVFPPDLEHPLRIELFGDEVESIRTFSSETQRSLQELPQASVSGLSPAGNLLGSGHFAGHLPPGSWVVLIEPGDLAEQARQFHGLQSDSTGLFRTEAVFQSLMRHPVLRVTALPSPSIEEVCHLRVESVERFSGDVARARDELDAATGSDVVLVACQSEGEEKRLGEVLAEGMLARSGRLHLARGCVHAGFRLVEEGGNVVVLGGQGLFHREEAHAPLPRRRIESRAIDSFLDLAEGDLVVHVSHGIGRFQGMQMLARESGAGSGRRQQLEEHLVVEYRGGARLYVPASKIDLVQKYVGGGKSEPELSKLGGRAWGTQKARVEDAVRDLAAEMIQIQALRESMPGHPYPPDTPWQRELEASFPYQETPDQLTALGEIKADQQRPRPMDRLICGDVGYGKTELAVRAAFKVAEAGRQAAVLVPTTVLAEQHYRTFSARMAGFPLVVKCLSRFRSGQEEAEILEALATGGVDVIIGTHRLLSADVRFHDLGLVIVDEEQRFGVEHKERLKHLRAQVDVLTLTATPIPRTLHLSLLGIRDISNLETPPPGRLAIETRIVRWDDALIRNAIQRELSREGQVYFVHNRVHDIEEVRGRLLRILPGLRVAVAHGQMSEHRLESAMTRFLRHEADILLATTIIESGLDIPRANTMFINEADHYGLADLHQLRGRVGRSRHRAYCYLVLDGERRVNETAAKRLKAMEELTSLGSGFKIALRDLEIRGAGNILGVEQSGHISAVGYELYCQLLENAVRSLKKLPIRAPLEVTVDLPWEAYLPREYVPGQKQRIEAYRRLGRVRSLPRLDEFRDELRDRYGPVPPNVVWLLRMQEMRIRAAWWRIGSIHLEGPGDGVTGPTYAVFGYRGPLKVRQLAARVGPDLRIVDEKQAYFLLGHHQLEPLPMYEALREVLAVEGEGTPP
jgi:transcription-repair coupling factor (superfamily II helicase)